MCISRSLKSCRRLPYDDDGDDSHQHSLSLSQRPGTLVWTVVSIVLEIVDCVKRDGEFLLPVHATSTTVYLTSQVCEENL